VLQARVLLASTKAAGMGLNVTCACRAVILDVWWNGAFEDQVIAMCQLPTETVADAYIFKQASCNPKCHFLKSPWILLRSSFKSWSE
jgi:hypothetical protein